MSRGRGAEGEDRRSAPGVSGVMWLDDVEDLSTPVELMDAATVEQYWRDGTALYSRDH